MYYRRRHGRSVLGLMIGLIAVVMVVHAIISAVITLGIIVGVVGGVALAFPVVRAMIGRKMGPRPLETTGTALMRVLKR